MNKLIIHTKYHVTVELLLVHFEMVERHHHREVIDGGIAIDHLDDCMSQALVFWLSMAEGCGLIEDYLFARSMESRDKSEDLAQEVLQWIEHTKQEMEQDPNYSTVVRLSILVDYIEKLCKERIKKAKAE